MSDLISRKALIDEVYQMNGNRYVKETIVNVIREQPAIRQEQTEPAAAERINTAREMIEAEIKQRDERLETVLEHSSVMWHQGVLHGLRFAIECITETK